MKGRIVSIVGVWLVLALALAAAIWVAGPVGADAPTLLNYQGRLTDAGGAPINSTLSMTFGIYSAATGGSALWSETQSVTVTNGLFSVLLGSSTALPASVFDGTERYLEVQVGTETLSPRQQIASSAYALNAWDLTGNSGTTAGTNFLGTTDNVTLTLAVSNTAALRLVPHATSPNVLGGYSGNTVTTGAFGATIGGGGTGGWINRVTDNYGTVGGGVNNQAGDNAGTTSDRTSATVGGGRSNTASGGYATVGGGYTNTASASWATVGGGRDNTASGEGATVGGGYGNTAEGTSSFAAGLRAKANADGCFVWGDSTNAEVSCNTTDSFIVRASGGITLFTNSGLTAGARLPAGSGSWSALSDRALKVNLAPVDGQEVLARLVGVPIGTWSYRTQDPAIRHMGPTAQDFYAAFGLGEDERHISTVDADGVALAAIQGLYQAYQEQEARILRLEARLAALEALVATVGAGLSLPRGGEEGGP